MDLTKPVTQAFTRALPKIELHAHLSGSISRQCLHELWATKKARDPAFAVEDPWVCMPRGKVDYSLQTFFQVFGKSIYQLVTDAESIRFATASVLRDFAADGVRYLELRTIPRVSVDGALSKDGYVRTVLECISSFQSASESRGGMVVKLILSMGMEGWGVCRCSLCIFCSPVSNEYLLAASHFGLGRGDILRLCRKGVGAIFGGDEEKKRLWGLLDEFEGVELESDKVDCVVGVSSACVVGIPRGSLDG